MTSSTVADAPVLAAARWTTNGHLIADVARLGYLRTTDRIVDATWGRGRFWTRWSPTDGELVAHDLKTDGVDFRHLPHDDRSFDVVVLDPDYKLNGTPALGDFDDRYGVNVPKRWQDRVADALAGIPEGARVLRPGGRLLYKTQDQVVSGRIRWLTLDATALAHEHGLDLVDRFDLLGGGRPQPMEGRTQKHAHGRPSSLLVFEKGRRWASFAMGQPRPTTATGVGAPTAGLRCARPTGAIGARS